MTVIAIFAFIIMPTIIHITIGIIIACITIATISTFLNLVTTIIMNIVTSLAIIYSHRQHIVITTSVADTFTTMNIIRIPHHHQHITHRTHVDRNYNGVVFIRNTDRHQRNQHHRRIIAIISSICNGQCITDPLGSLGTISIV